MQRHTASAVTLMAAVFLLAGCNLAAVGDNGKGGSGALITEQRAVPPFDAISVSDGLTVEVTFDGERAVTVTADDNLIADVRTRVSGRELQIVTLNDARPSTGTVVRVTAPGLSALGAVGGSRVEVGPVETATLSIGAGSGSTVVVSGSVDRLIIAASSGSSVLLGDLAARDAFVSATGGSRVEVRATDSLTGRATDGALIVIIGAEPAVVEVTTNDGGSVRR